MQHIDRSGGYLSLRKVDTAQNQAAGQISMALDRADVGNLVAMNRILPETAQSGPALNLALLRQSVHGDRSDLATMSAPLSSSSICMLTISQPLESVNGAPSRRVGISVRSAANTRTQ